MKKEDLKTLSDSDIIARRAEAIRDMMKTQLQHRTAQLEDTSKIKKLRQQIARCNCELRARELANGLGKGTLVERDVARQVAESSATDEAAAPSKRSRFGLGFIRDALLGKRSS